MEKAARRIAWTSAIIHGLVHASVLLLPALLGDLQRAFAVSLLDVLAIANVMYFLFGMAAIPAGYLADRVGSRSMLILAAGGSGMSLLLIALAPTFTVFALGMVALGLSAGVYHPSGLSLLSRGVASGERGRAIGIHGVGGNIGEAVAPSWAALFAATLGWRYGFAAAALLAFVCAVLASSLPKEIIPGSAGSPSHPSSFGSSVRAFGFTLATFWKSRPLRWLLLSTIASGFVYRGVLTFLPLHLGRAHAGGTTSASYLTSLVLVAGIIAQRVGGELADRFAREPLFLAEVILFVPVLVLVALTSGASLVFVAMCFGFLWYLAQPLANALASTYAHTTDHGLLYGVQFAATFGIGSFSTTLGGLLVSAGGSGLAFLGFGAAALLQVAAAAALVRHSRGGVPPSFTGSRAP